MNKKKQKNFINLGLGRWRNQRPEPRIQKFFGAFFQKSTASFSALLAGFGVLLAALALFSREPGRLLHPQLWAEDGFLWIAQAYNDGAASLFRPVVGYLQTVSRLGAFLALLFPLTWTPFIFALLAFIIQLAPAALLLSERGKALVPSPVARLLLVAYYIAEPNSAEVYVNLTNAMWHLALVGFLLVLLPKPKTAFGVRLDGAVLVLSGLSGPLILYIASIAWWQVLAGRRQPDAKLRLLYAGLASACALVQLSLVLLHAAHSRHGTLGATLNRLFHIIANQVLLGGVIGGGAVAQLMGEQWWLHTLPPALVCLAGLVLGLLAFVKGPAAHRQLVVLGALILCSGLASPMVSFVQPQWFPMQYPSIGTRYYFIAMLAWFSTLLVLAGAPMSGVPFAGVAHWAARVLLAACLIGVVVDWRYPPYDHAGFYAAAKTFMQAPPGTTVTFPINPSPWTFPLTKR